MKKIAFIFMLVMLAGPGRALAGSVTMDATLILANNDPAALDRRLDHVTFQLRRMFKFEYYHYYGGGQAVVGLPGSSTIDLGHGNVLSVNATGDGKVRAEVNWLSGGKSVLNTTVSLKRGAHVILGGIPHEGGTLIVTLVAQ